MNSDCPESFGIAIFVKLVLNSSAFRVALIKVKVANLGF
jgi:hypothetical protein